ncbi:MAG TPA: hypothetical protein IGR64_17270 [Leptolyngbyaceae cyanobacterium M65_K2018_010]|nr:hypothetical protein [Leptolyngbyaceae cyanobacterium M65_K2018_010]
MEEQKSAKVTLYLPPDLHRQLKIRSAVEGEAMSSIAKRAIDFYLAHPEAIAECEAPGFGKTHLVYSCPSCSTPLVVRDDELLEVAHLAAADSDQALSTAKVSGMVIESGQLDEGELVICS